MKNKNKNPFHKSIFLFLLKLKLKLEGGSTFTPSTLSAPRGFKGAYPLVFIYLLNKNIETFMNALLCLVFIE